LYVQVNVVDAALKADLMSDASTVWVLVVVVNRAGKYILIGFFRGLVVMHCCWFTQKRQLLFGYSCRRLMVRHCCY